MQCLYGYGGWTRRPVYEYDVSRAIEAHMPLSTRVEYCPSQMQSFYFNFDLRFISGSRTIYPVRRDIQYKQPQSSTRE